MADRDTKRRYPLKKSMARWTVYWLCSCSTVLRCDNSSQDNSLYKKLLMYILVSMGYFIFSTFMFFTKCREHNRNTIKFSVAQRNKSQTTKII